MVEAFEPMRDCVKRCVEASWWEWEGGSSLFFWRWPDTHVKWAMTGQPHFMVVELPKFTKKQMPAKTEEDCVRMKEKVMKVRKRLYIEAGWVISIC